MENSSRGLASAAAAAVASASASTAAAAVPRSVGYKSDDDDTLKKKDNITNRRECRHRLYENLERERKLFSKPPERAYYALSSINPWRQLLHYVTDEPEPSFNNIYIRTSRKRRRFPPLPHPSIADAAIVAAQNQMT